MLDVGAGGDGCAEAYGSVPKAKAGTKARAVNSGQVGVVQRPDSGGTMDRATILRAAGAWLETVEPSIAGEGGNAEGGRRTFTDMLQLVGGWDLSEDEALGLASGDLYSGWCMPPWTDEDLAHKVHDAWVSAQGGERLGWRARRFINNLTGQPEISGYQWLPLGLFWMKPGKGADAPDVPVWIAPPFRIRGLTRSVDEGDYAPLVEFINPDGNPASVAVGAGLLDPDGNKLATALIARGLNIAPDREIRHQLVTYISRASNNVTTKIRNLERAGWLNGVFVMPSGAIAGEK